MPGIIKRPEGTEGALTTPIAQKLGALAKGGPGSRLSGARGDDWLYAAFACDTTGSMLPWFNEMKSAVSRIASEVWQRHKQCRIAYMPYKNHGDEDSFDGHHPFAMTGFTHELRQIEHLLSTVKRGGGGDGNCALEDVFHFLNHDAEWPRSAKKILTVIGDMPPHGVLDSMGNCPHEFNYENEIADLKQKGVVIYSVHCRDEADLASERMKKVAEFYRHMAVQTGGKCLTLSDVDELVQVLIGVCLKETGHLEDYIKQLGKLGRLTNGTKKNLLLLGGGK